MNHITNEQLHILKYYVHMTMPTNQFVIWRKAIDDGLLTRGHNITMFTYKCDTCMNLDITKDIY